MIDGGAVYLFSNNTKIKFRNGLFIDNSAAQGKKYPSLSTNIWLCLYNATQILLSNCLYVIHVREGGALYAGERNSELGAKHCRFERNWASYGMLRTP